MEPAAEDESNAKDESNADEPAHKEAHSMGPETVSSGEITRLPPREFPSYTGVARSADAVGLSPCVVRWLRG